MRAQRARRRARARRGRVHRKGRDDRRRSPPRCGAGAVEPGSFPRLRALPRARGRRPGPPSRARRRPRVPPRPGRRRGGVRAVRRGRSAPRRLAASAPRAARRDRARGADAVPSRSRRVPRGFLRRRCRDAAAGGAAAASEAAGGQPHVRVQETRASFARSFLLAADALARALADAGGSDGVAEGEADAAEGRFSNGRPRRRTPPPPGRTEPPRRDGRVSSRVFPRPDQFHKVGRRPRASRLSRGDDARAPGRRAARAGGDAPRANRSAHQLLFMAWGRARGLRSDETLKPFLESTCSNGSSPRWTDPRNAQRGAPRGSIARAVSAAAVGPDAKRGARATRGGARPPRGNLSRRGPGASDEAPSSSDDES